MTIALFVRAFTRRQTVCAHKFIINFVFVSIRCRNHGTRSASFAERFSTDSKNPYFKRLGLFARCHFYAIIVNLCISNAIYHRIVFVAEKCIRFSQSIFVSCFANVNLQIDWRLHSSAQFDRFILHFCILAIGLLIADEYYCMLGADAIVESSLITAKDFHFMQIKQ